MQLLLTICFECVSVQWLENRSKTFEPTYLYTMEKVISAVRMVLPLSPELSLSQTAQVLAAKACDE